MPVEVREIAREVTPQRRVLGHETPGEGGTPALLEDRPLHLLHRAVGLRAAGTDEALLGAGALDRAAELSGAELAAVVGADGLECPACAGELARDATHQVAA